MVIMHLYRHLSIALYYISLLFGLGNDDQNRNQNINNRDNLVGRPTRQCLPELGFWGTAIDSQSTKIVLEECDVSFPLVNREKSNL